MLQQVTTEELSHIKALESPMRALIENNIIASKEHLCLSYEKNFLGVKPVKEHRTMASFYVDYKPLIKTLKYVSEELGIAQSELNFASEQLSWAAMIKGDYQGEQLSLTKNLEPIKNNDSRFVPAIAAVNGYDYDDRFSFYLLVVSKKGIDDGLLTIDRYNVAGKLKEQLLNSQSAEEKAVLFSSEIGAVISKKFKASLDNFWKDEEKLREISCNQDELTAITLDIYDKNRVVNSINSDSRLRRSIQSLVQQADKYYEGYDNCQALLSFIASEDPFYQTEMERSNLEYLFQIRDAYRTVRERLLKGNDTPLKMKAYINMQVEVKQNLPL